LATSLSDTACFQAASEASNDDWAFVTRRVATATLFFASVTIFFLVSTLSKALKSSLSAATCSASISSRVVWDVD
jgi:hypothetical protein